ncbi:cell division protein FtsW [Kitasatospora herbaricolor]|uniref:FtsW/RodA/SpoVE family cell cycle protein n=1 Tax=Kitasatospora herbaricolor TaxID=68217 RepID=UPI001749D5A0|nr:FtsW/RodA/SpoVE family cell cycle protein [Kitasatospora herbaricolor]MDQ0310247.1 cell division protein FtsW (lipid II flippase) [Kitasatospora herbaricolor]GGV21189.1 cell division protein FtsW [Kitasatospora herbaricolor]
MATPSAVARSTPRPRPVRTRRNTELALVLAAVLIAVLGYNEVGVNIDGSVPSGAAGYGAALGVLALLAHGVIRWRAPYADPLLLPIAILLNGVGLVVIYRLDRATPRSEAAPTQLLWSTLGVALFIAVVLSLRDHKRLQRYAYSGALVALVLLVLPVLFPPVYGSRIWITVGPLSFQPGEFAKILLAVFFAAYLAVHRDALALTGRRIWGVRLPVGRVLGPVLLIWAAFVGVLVLETDLGTSLLFFGLFVIMLYVATARSGWIAIGLLLAAVGAAGVGWLSPHVHSRVTDWLDPLGSIEAGRGANQIAQSLFAFAWGGLLGTGLGNGHSILIGFAAKSDFILATVGEELGLTGLIALFLLYALLVSRGFRTGIALTDPFGRLLAIGLAAIVGIQVFVVAGGVLDLIPLTGMTLPFIAQGGSSVVTNWIIVALLVRMSDVARRPAPRPEEA